MSCPFSLLLTEKSSESVRFPIHDHQFPTHFSLPLTLVGVAITYIQRLEVKAVKHPPDVRVIVDADHHLAFAATHEVGHPRVVFKREVNAITGGLPIRRVHVMEGMSTVVAFSAFEPR